MGLITKKRLGSNPLFFQWSYAGQPGVPWKKISKKGTNNGSNITYTYVDWQNYDRAFTSSEIAVGDEVELIVLAAGCSPGGHDGHVYLDQVTTGDAAGLSISAVGDATTYPGGTIEYIYTYKNSSATGVNSAKVVIQMPESQNSPTPYELIFNSITQQPNTGSEKVCTYYPKSVAPNFYPSNSVVCEIGDLANNAEGTFKIKFSVPGEWPVSYGPINHGNYPISANSINPSLGNLVQTEMINNLSPPPSYSNLVVDTSGLLIDGENPSIYLPGSYPDKTYTCKNESLLTDAPNATCDISNLPDGITKKDCEITGNTGPVWIQPQNIPAGQTVTCHVSGILVDYTVSTKFDVLVSSNSVNNENNVTNKATLPFYIYNNPETPSASLNGSPNLIPVKVCCGRPIMLYDLVAIESDLAATYTIIDQSPNIRCELGKSNGNYFVKIFGRPGSCTIQGTKDAEISAPLIIQTI
jgi:hypothetical protein